jgi:glycosyltransferase involved in cell wall biosynthesis
MNQINNNLLAKKISIVFPKDSDSVFNNSSVTFGGATVQLYNVAKELGKSFSVYAMINEYEDVDPSCHKDFTIMFTYHRSDSIFSKLSKFHRAVQEAGPDVLIQRGLSFFSPLLALYCALYGIKFIFMFAHDRESRGRFQRTNRINFLFHLLLIFANALIVQNEYQRDRIPQRYARKIFKIKNGHTIEYIDFSKKDGVLWVSRLEPWKRPEKFLELAKKLPELQFTMIAPKAAKHEKYAEKIYTMAREIPNIKLHNFVSLNSIDKFFHEAKLFVNTSEEEGFPNTFVQSCKNYTPILSLKVNPDNCISRNRIGFCCNDNDHALFDYLTSIMNDNELYENFAKSAYMYAKENHNIEENVKLLQCLI